MHEMGDSSPILPLLVNLIAMATTTANHLQSACLCPSMKGGTNTRATARNGAGVASNMPHLFTPMTLALVLTVGGVKGITASESNQHYRNEHKITH